MKSKHESLAAAVADGETTDDFTDPADPVARNLARLGDLATAFRGAAATDDEQRPRLFQWRHLQVESELGQGGFGTVYQAWDPVLKRRVALKLGKETSRSEARDRWIIAEARRMARVRHPNVLAVHGADSDGGRTGIWCDLIEGETLQQVLDREQTLSTRSVLSLALVLADALATIHERGLSHGDIKPANVMIRSDGEPILMDFGAGAEPGTPGPLAGSPIVMAPELFAGGATTPASDIYAFGALLYRTLCGRYPVEAEDFDQLAARHAQASAPDLSALPLGYRRLLRGMLSHSLAERPEAADVGARLDRIRTARARWTRRVAVAAVMASLAVGTVASLLAYRSAAQSRDRIERVKDVMAEAAESVVPTRQSGPTSVVAMYQKMAELIEERLADYPAALAEMRVVTGVGLGKLGETRQGLEIAEAGIALMQEVRGDVPRDLGSSWLEVATVRAMVEDIAGAEQAIRNALAALEDLETESAAAERLVAKNRLALLLGQQGRWHEEVAAARELLADRRAMYGEDSIRLAVDYHNLAAALATIGDFESALENERRAAELLRAEGDEDSVRMGFVKTQLANMLVMAERYDEAEQALDEVSRIYAANLPPDHMYFDFVAEQKAALLVETGRTAEALPELERLIALEGEPYALTRLKAAQSLARVRMQQGRWADAERLYREVQQTKPARHQPLTAYFDAAIAYTAFKGGTREQPPTDVLQAAQERMRELDLVRIEEYRYLQAWMDELRNPS